MRPTVIRLIVGSALGIAFSVSLMLPGAVVFPQESPIRHLAAPDTPSARVVQAEAIEAPKQAPPQRPVVVRHVYVPTVRTVPAASVVRRSPSRSTSSPRPKPVKRTSPPAQTLTTMAAPPVVESEDDPEEAEPAEQPKKWKSSKKPKKEAKPAKPAKPKKEAKPVKPAKPKKAKERGQKQEKSGNRGEKDEDREDDDHGDDDHGGRHRGGDGNDG
jgi:hypothetical protein